MLDHSLDDSESGPTVASVPARDWSGGIAVQAELRDLQESSSCWACTTHESRRVFTSLCPTLNAISLFHLLLLLRLTTSDDIHTDKGRARDVHNRGEALLCPFFTTTGLLDAGAMQQSQRTSGTDDCEQAHAGFVPSGRRPCAWPCDDPGSRRADEKPRLRSDRHGVEGGGMRCVGMPHHVADRHVN
jgi:hypothetical protein